MARTLKITTKKLDDLWSEIVKLEGKCEKCGSRVNLNAHHIFGRRNFSVRWNLDNGISLCVSCHKFGRHSAHESPMEFANWLIQERGQDWYDVLHFEANKTIRKIDKESVYRQLLESKVLLEPKVLGT